MSKKLKKVNDLDYVLSTMQEVIVRLRELRGKYMMAAWKNRHSAHADARSPRQKSGFTSRMHYAISAARATNRTLVRFLLLRHAILERAFDVSEI